MLYLSLGYIIQSTKQNPKGLSRKLVVWEFWLPSIKHISRFQCALKYSQGYKNNTDTNLKLQQLIALPTCPDIWLQLEHNPVAVACCRRLRWTASQVDDMYLRTTCRRFLAQAALTDGKTFIMWKNVWWLKSWFNAALVKPRSTYKQTKYTLKNYSHYNLFPEDSVVHFLITVVCKFSSTYSDPCQYIHKNGQLVGEQASHLSIRHLSTSELQMKSSGLNSNIEFGCSPQRHCLT